MIIWFMEFSIHQNATSSLLPSAWVCIDNFVLVLDWHCCDSKNHIILGLTADLGAVILAPGHNYLFKNVPHHNYLSNIYIFIFILEVATILSGSLTLTTTIPCSSIQATISEHNSQRTKSANSSPSPDTY